MRRRIALTALVYGLSLPGYSVASPSSHINIPAGDLASALDRLARETHVEFIYSAEDVKGVHTQGVHGQLTSEDAVRALIKGTGLTVKVHPSGAILVTPNPIAEKTPLSGSPSAPPPQRATTAARDQPTHRGEEILVTASKRAEPLFQVAGAVSAISGEELADRGANEREDYVAFLPGLGMQSFGHTGFNTVFLRGIAAQNVAATTAAYIDEIPVGAATAITRNGFFAPDLNPTDLERVEVLKGPQGTLYGATSMGGVVKYVTRAPDLYGSQLRLDEDFNLIDGGSAGTTFRVMASTPLVKDQLGVRVSAYYRHSGGFIDDSGVGGADTNRANDRGLRAALLYRPTDTVTLKLTAMEQENQSHGNDTADYNLDTGRPIIGPYAEFRYVAEPSRIRLQLYSAELNYHSRHFNLISATGYSKFNPINVSDETRVFQTAGDTGASPPNPLRDSSNDNTRKLTQELRLASDRIGICEFMIGGFYQREWDDFSFEDSFVNSPELSYSVRGINGTLSEYAGFIDATLYFSPRFDFTAGYRYSRLQQREDHFTGGLLNNQTAPDEVRHTAEAFSEAPSTYLAAARYHANSDLMLYARAASGYRPGGGRVLPPGIPPGFSNYYTSDRIWSYELGEKFRGLDGRLRIDVDAFWIDWSNIQSLQPIPGTPYLFNANAGTANSRGLEIETTYVPANGFTLGLYGAYANARFTATVPSIANNGDTLTYVPKVAWSAYSRFERPVRDGWKVFIAGDYRFEGHRLDTYRVPLPGYGIWDARAGLQNDGLQVTLYVRNLTNKYVHEGSNLQSLPSGEPYAFVIDTPRTIGLSAVQTF